VGQCLLCCHRGKAIAGVDKTHLMAVEQCQAAAGTWTKSTTLGHGLYAAVVYTTITI